MAFEDAYDEPTLRAIDRVGAAGDARVSRGGWRGAMVAGALHAAMAGVRDLFEFEPPAPRIVEVRPEPNDGGDGPVRVVMVPGAPRLTRAFVRM
jgi:hypothetical protein